MVKRQVFGKRYALVFGIVLIIANGYTFWPALAYGNSLISCTLIFGILSYDVKGAVQVVGAPLYSEMQLVMQSGSIANETAIYRSDNNNLTQLFQDYPTSNSVTQYLNKIDGFSGLINPVPASETGVTITLQNKTFDGIHVAYLLYSIRADRGKLRDRQSTLLDRACIDDRKPAVFWAAPIWTGSANSRNNQ